MSGMLTALTQSWLTQFVLCGIECHLLDKMGTTWVTGCSKFSMWSYIDLPVWAIFLNTHTHTNNHKHVNEHTHTHTHTHTHRHTHTLSSLLLVMTSAVCFRIAVTAVARTSCVVIDAPPAILLVIKTYCGHRAGMFWLGAYHFTKALKLWCMKTQTHCLLVLIVIIFCQWFPKKPLHGLGWGSHKPFGVYFEIASSLAPHQGCPTLFMEICSIVGFSLQPQQSTPPSTGRDPGELLIRWIRNGKLGLEVKTYRMVDLQEQIYLRT